MSYNTDFIFEGEYCRKPAQRLGGRSVPLESRAALLERAAQERTRREKDRVVAKSIRIIQSVVRGFLIRRRIKRSNRQDFVELRKEKYTVDELGWQISRLNSFYDSKNETDIEALIELGKSFLPVYPQVFQLCISDSLWAQRIRLFLRKALNSVGDSTIRHGVFLRMVQIFTEAPSDTPESLLFYANTWLDLVACASFFTVWRSQIEVRLPPPQLPDLDSQVPSDVQTRIECYVVTHVLRAALNVVNKLEGSELKFSIENDYRSARAYQSRAQLTGQMVTNRILEKFTESFCDNVIPQDKFFRVLPHLMFSVLSKTMPWLQWVKYLQHQHCDRFTVPSSTARNLLYAILALTPKAMISSHTEELLAPVLKLMHSVDTQFAPLEMAYFDNSTGDVESDSYGEPWSPDVSQYIKNCRTIFYRLADVLNHLPSSLIVDKDSKWSLELLVPIISSIIRYEPRHVVLFKAMKFEFPGILAYNRDFLRRLFRLTQSTLGSDPKSMHYLIVFTWTLNHLMATLHDAEFIAGIPMTRDELKMFIPQLVALYADTIVQDKNGPKERLNYSANKVAASCLMSIHNRNTRMQLFPEEVFYSAPLQLICPMDSHCLFFQDFSRTDANPDSVSRMTLQELKLMKVLMEFPFALSFQDRVQAWHRLIDLDRFSNYVPQASREHVQIRRLYIYEDAYEKLSPNNVPDMRSHLRISLVNVVGAPEAGVDGGGLLREFLTEATKAGVDPNRGLFRLDSQNRIYPNPIAKKVIPDYRKHYYLIGRLVGKALYEQTLLELPLAAFFIQTCISHKVPSAVDYLATLDPALHKQLLGLKNFPGDLTSLGLDFTLTLDEFGETRTVNLKDDGGTITVDKSNVIEYIHLVADYKINKEMQDEILYFRRGLCDVVPILGMFSWREMQTLISGSDKPIDIADWIENTNYTGGFSFEHPTIQLFWQVVHSFDEPYLRKLLKFVTSCSRPPLLGFKDLVPHFGIQNAGQVDRLPTSATCMNLLKLPEFSDAGTLREKLVYAIDAQAGFELS